MTNFKRPANTQKAFFKLWVKYKREYVNDRLPEIKVYYSHERPGDSSYGYDKLLEMIGKRLHKVEKYRLYNNITKEELKKYPENLSL